MTFRNSFQNLRYRFNDHIFPCFAIRSIELRRGKKYDYRGAIKVIRTNYRAWRCNNNVMPRDDTVSCEFTACRLSPIISRDSPLSSRDNDNKLSCWLLAGTPVLCIELLNFFARVSRSLWSLCIILYIYRWRKAHLHISFKKYCFIMRRKILDSQ